MGCLSTEKHAHQRPQSDEHRSHRCLGEVGSVAEIREDSRHTSLLDLDEDLVLPDWREKMPDQSRERRLVK